MVIQFLGAAKSVTGSMHLISINGTNLLLDCGLFQGKRSESYEKNRNFPFNPNDINAVILSHAHLDHTGNIPNLVKQGYTGPIYCTSATKDLCNIMLYDSAYIQQRDIEYINKKHIKKHEPIVNTLYDVNDVTDSLTHFISVGYKKIINISKDISLQFFDAGHILGSAITKLIINDNGTKKIIGFTGDLGRQNAPILKDPQPIGMVDVLITESTYGGKLHEPASDMKQSLLNAIEKTILRGGKVIIPSFSVGRTQEIVYLLSELFKEGKISEIPIYVDSPLSVNATEIFKIHAECFDKETLARIHAHDDPFGLNKIQYVRSVDDSKKLNNSSNSCVIISASGMCEGGRVVHHLANNIENPKNMILFVGYQAENTLGRRILEKHPEVSMLGEVFKLNAEVAVLNSFSAHADQNELKHFITKQDKHLPKHTFLVHGEIKQSEKLLEQLKNEGYKNELYIPSPLEKIAV